MLWHTGNQPLEAVSISVLHCHENQIGLPPTLFIYFVRGSWGSIKGTGEERYKNAEKWGNIQTISDPLGCKHMGTRMLHAHNWDFIDFDFCLVDTAWGRRSLWLMVLIHSKFCRFLLSWASRPLAFSECRSPACSLPAHCYCGKMKALEQSLRLWGTPLL